MVVFWLYSGFVPFAAHAALFFKGKGISSLSPPPPPPPPFCVLNLLLVQSNPRMEAPATKKKYSDHPKTMLFPQRKFASAKVFYM